MAWWFVWLAGMHVARAETLYLESDPLATREEAEQVAAVATGEGCGGEVVRRYVRGQGWRYLYRSAPLSDAEIARGCMERVALPTGGMRLVERDGLRTRVAKVEQASERAGTPTGRTAADLDARDVIERLLRAHAGTTEGPSAAERVLFRYERRTGDGLHALHTYARRGDEVYLHVDVLAGPGVSSRAGVSAGRAWLEGSDVLLDAAYVREQLDRFAPEAVLRITAELAAGRLDLPELEQVHVAGVSEIDGQEVVALAYEGDRLTPGTRLLIDARTWRLVALERGEPGQLVRWRFLGWKEMDDGSLRPERVQVWRNGQLVDDVVVQELEVAPTLPEAWFRPPNG